MTFYIEFKNALIGKVDPLTVGSFSFMSGLFNVYAGAKLLLKDFAREHNNDIRTGMDVDIHFVDDTSTANISGIRISSGKEYVVNMAVLSYNKVPGPSTTDYIDITLVSKSYFYNELLTASHNGTVSQIVEKIFNKRFSKMYNSLDCQDSGEKDRIRYQLGERSMDFLDRISKYAYIDNKPVYLYSDAKGNFNFKGVSNFEKVTPKYLITPFLAQQNHEKSTNDLTTIPLVAVECTFNGASKDSISEYTSQFCTSMFVSPGEYNGGIVYNNNEDGNAQSEVLTPTKKEFYGWNLTPEDALGISVRKSFERLANTYTMNATFDSFLVDELPIGGVSYVLLPYTPTSQSSNGSEVNAGEGKYMVTQVKYVYENEMLKTYAKFVQIGY